MKGTSIFIWLLFIPHVSCTCTIFVNRNCTKVIQTIDHFSPDQSNGFSNIYQTHKSNIINSISPPQINYHLEGRPTEFTSDICRKPRSIKGVLGKETLNSFDASEIKFFLGLDKVDEKFDYHQIAQKYTNKHNIVKINRVSIYRLIKQEISGNTQDKFLQKTKFRIRIYDIDSLTGRPTIDLCNRIIEVQDKENEVIKVNLNPYDIIISKKFFFIAVEWLHISYNKSEVEVHKDMRSEDNLLQLNSEIDIRDCFQPIIGMSNKKSSENNAWALNFQNQWVPYIHFSPELTDFAISAEIEY